MHQTKTETQARWRKKSPTKRIEVNLPVGAVDILDALAKQSGLSRAKVIAQLLRQAESARKDNLTAAAEYTPQAAAEDWACQAAALNHSERNVAAKPAEAREAVQFSEYEDNVFGEFLSETIAKAKKRDRDSAVQLLAQFCMAVDRGEQPHIFLLDYFSAAFKTMLDDNASADRALGVVRPKGRSRENHDERDYLIAALIHYYLEKGEENNPSNAGIRVAAETDISEATIQRAWEKHGDLKIPLSDKDADAILTILTS